MAAAERGDAGVAGGGVQLRQAGALRESPRERVLTRTRADDEHLHRPSLLRGFDGRRPTGNTAGAMQEPGIDEHEWVSEWEVIDPLLRESPTEALPEAYDLIARG